MTGQEALALGLVDSIADDPEAATLGYFENHLAGKSSSSLRFAVEAARIGYRERMLEKLDRVESLYLENLMSTRDAVEGLEAFMAKRPAKWENR